MGFLPLENKYEETVLSVNITKKSPPQFKLFKYIYRFYHICKRLRRSYNGYQSHYVIIPF